MAAGDADDWRGRRGKGLPVSQDSRDPRFAELTRMTDAAGRAATTIGRMLSVRSSIQIGRWSITSKKT